MLEFLVKVIFISSFDKGKPISGMELYARQGLYEGTTFFTACTDADGTAC